MIRFVVAKILRPLKRRFDLYHHCACVKDLDFDIAHHERMRAALPAEIERLKHLRKYHQGRADTARAPTNRVNWHLGRSGQSR